MLISNIGDKIVFATDSIIIGMFLPISALTFYAIGGTLIEQLRSFVMSMASIFNPLSSSLEARKEARTLALVVTTGARAAMLLGLPICIGFFMLGKQFIGLWMGAEYAEPAGQILVVLAIGHLIGLPYYTISGVLYGLGRHHIVAYSRIVEGAGEPRAERRAGAAGTGWSAWPSAPSIPHIIVVAGILPRVARAMGADRPARVLPVHLPAAAGRVAAVLGRLLADCQRGAARTASWCSLHRSASALRDLRRALLVHRSLSGRSGTTLAARLRQRLLGRRPAEGVS